MHPIDFLTFYAGVCFGEIALLGSGNMNRRTANVRAHGFTTLYVLFKEDLVDALRDYPEDKARVTLLIGCLQGPPYLFTPFKIDLCPHWTELLPFSNIELIFLF